MGCWIRDTGYGILGIGYRTQDTGGEKGIQVRDATGSIVAVRISFKMCAISTHYTHSISFSISRPPSGPPPI